MVRLILLAAALAASLSPAAAEPAAVEIEARPIERFLPRSDQTLFGSLRFLGGFSYSGSDRRLAGISAFRLRADGTSFLAVSDTGLWFEGTVERDATGRPTGFSDARIAPILDASGVAQPTKGDADAEGMAIAGSRVLVSYERDHRIEAFDASDPLVSAPMRVAQPVPSRELRSNGGLETVAVSPGGMVVTVAEQSIDAAGNLFAGILGRSGGVFTVRREEPWAVTDGAFLPGGDLLLLERRYEGFGRIGMRVRRIPGASIQVGALVDGPVLMEADVSNEIDNMEALEVHVNAAGETILSILSDDNSSFFQRNLYLEFRLEDGVSG